MWLQILSINIESSIDWVDSAPSAQKIFCLKQINSPTVGRLTIGQRVGDSYSDLHRFPASSSDFLMLFPYTGGERNLSLKAGGLKFAGAWEIELLEFHQAGEDAEEPFVNRARQFNLINLERLQTVPNPLNPKFIDTEFWVPVNASSPYTIGRFEIAGIPITDPLIKPPITLAGFKVVFTGMSQQSELIKVAIFES